LPDGDRISRRVGAELNVVRIAAARGDVDRGTPGAGLGTADECEQEDEKGDRRDQQTRDAELAGKNCFVHGLRSSIGSGAPDIGSAARVL
jgi:hypothetical protein